MQKTVMELVEANKADFVSANAGVFHWDRKYGKDFKKYFDNDRETLIAELENILLGINDNDSKQCALDVYRLIYETDKTTVDRVRSTIRKIIDNAPQHIFGIEVRSFLAELCKSSTDDLLLYAYECENDSKDIIGMTITINKLCETFPETKHVVLANILIQFFLVKHKEEIKTRGLPDFLRSTVKDIGMDLTVNIIKTILESEYISEKKLNLTRLAVQEVPEVWNIYEKEIENNRRAE